MEPTSSKPLPEATRPRTLDFLLLCCGVGLSVFLAGLSGLQAGPPESAPLHATLLKVFPTLLLLPAGVLLLWPVFYTTQKIVGRRQELTLAEWLWGLAWLETLALAAWILLKGLGTAPEFMNSAGFQNALLLGHVIFLVSTGALAALLYVVGLFGRWAVPWTHTLGLALLMWPLLPLGLWAALGIKLE